MTTTMDRRAFIRSLIALWVALGGALIRPTGMEARPPTDRASALRPLAAVVAAPWGAIGDYVWYDADGDGIEDVGEPGIANVQLA
ncbi:MAG: hypothetical protein N2439_00165, partial [Anaerolineae bacterium]|nr:hypothetical protein [Anaerolineae bacterium]